MSPALFVLAAWLAIDPAAAQEAADLIRLALKGQSTAVRLMTRRLLPVIHARVGAYFSRRAGRRVAAHDAEDLAQEIWTELLRDDGRLLRAYDPQRGKTLEGYVGLLCRRELWRREQEAGRLKRGSGAPADDLDDVPVPDGLPGPERDVLGRDLAATLRAHLHAVLPPRGRAVLAFVFEDELDPKEAASALGVELQVVYNWQHRIRQESRAFLARQEQTIPPAMG